jgi:hypothetical protein
MPGRDDGPKEHRQNRPSLASIFTIVTNAFRSKTVSVGSISTQHETCSGGSNHANPSPDLPGPDGLQFERICLVRPLRGAHVMINPVTLAVSFPVFGTNYYSQQFESRKVLTLMFDKKFEALLIPAAANHFNNEVVGLNDQFRFLNDVLTEHLLEIEVAQASRRSASQFTF